MSSWNVVLWLFGAYFIIAVPIALSAYTLFQKRILPLLPPPSSYMDSFTIQWFFTLSVFSASTATNYLTRTYQLPQESYEQVYQYTKPIQKRLIIISVPAVIVFVAAMRVLW